MTVASIAAELEEAPHRWSTSGPASAASGSRARQLRAWAVQLRALEGEETEFRHLGREDGVLETMGHDLQRIGDLMVVWSQTVRERIES